MKAFQLNATQTLTPITLTEHSSLKAGEALVRV